MANPKVKHLPYNEEAERACLGSALLSKECLFSVLSELQVDDFFEVKHQTIYNALTSLQKRNVDVDTLTLAEELNNSKKLEKIGGALYLKECCDSMVALSSLEFYINIVKDQAVLRNMLTVVRRIDEEYRTKQIEDVDSFIADSEEKFKKATSKRRISTFRTSEEVAQIVAMGMKTQIKIEEEFVTGLTTGYPNINKYTQGFQKGEVTIVAARPSVGKTALALNFAYRVATRKNIPVAIFSLEMSAESLVKRLIAASSNVAMQKINTGALNDIERAKIKNALKEVGNAPIYIDDSSKIRLMDIVAKSRQLQSKHPDLGLIIIDYLGLVQTENKSSNANARQEEVRMISLTIKNLARELKLPIVLISQLSRDVEKRDSKKPMMSDLRDSGSIEQDADVIMLLYREDYYSKYGNKKNDPGKKNVKDLSGSERMDLMKAQLNEQLPGDVSYVEVNVAKNRNGQCGIAGLFFYKAFGRFDPPTKEFEEQMRNIATSNED